MESGGKRPQQSAAAKESAGNGAAGSGGAKKTQPANRPAGKYEKAPPKAKDGNGATDPKTAAPSTAAKPANAAAGKVDTAAHAANRKPPTYKSTMEHADSKTKEAAAHADPNAKTQAQQKPAAPSNRPAHHAKNTTKPLITSTRNGPNRSAAHQGTQQAQPQPAIAKDGNSSQKPSALVAGAPSSISFADLVKMSSASKPEEKANAAQKAGSTDAAKKPVAAPANATSASDATSGDNGSTWKAGKDGGSVLTWLAQKASPTTAPHSTGAIEYLNQMQQKKDAATATVIGGTASPKPASPKTSAPTWSPVANEGLTVFDRLAQMLPATATRDAEPSTSAGKPHSASPPVPSSSGLAGIKLAPQALTPSAGEPPLGKVYTPVPSSYLQSTQLAGSGAPHALSSLLEDPGMQAQFGQNQQQYSQQHQQQQYLRGRRRQQGNFQAGPSQPRQFQQDNQRKMQEEYERIAHTAQETHEEALRSDPEYRKNFEACQDIQEAQSKAYEQFWDKYAAQQNYQAPQVASARLDIPSILDLIDKHDVVFICTDTGSGKSTYVPKALLELSPDTHVVSTQPRRTATISIANRVASLRRENVGEDVGYWIRGEKKGDDQTRLWYMTSYTLLLHLLSSPVQPPFTHIVLDEFHERQPDIEVIVALLRLCLKRKSATFKLIIMSATLNTEDWEDYFAGLTVATYKQSEPEHPIHDHFIEDTCALLGMQYIPAPNLLQRSQDYSIVEKHVCIAQNLIMFLNSCTSPMHSIIVFLPGRAHVENLQQWIEEGFSNRMDAIPWHSAVDLKVIEEAIQRVNPQRQKVYLATDIAEVSITIPDVVFVIDLVLVKRPKIVKEQPASILYPPLLTQWISKGSVAQRRGRIGRVQQGFYFCLLPAEVVLQLPDYAQPPIENSRVDELSLHCLQVVTNPVAIYSVCHGQPLFETIRSAMEELSHLGCIINKADALAVREHISEVTINSEWNSLIMTEATEVVRAAIDEYEYTFVGRLLQLIPVSPQPGMLVFFGFLTGLESLMILAAAVTSSLSPFSTSPVDHMRNRRRKHDIVRAMEDTENVMRDMCCGLRSDIVAIMKAVLTFRINMQELGAGSPPLRQWCQQHYLSYEKLTAILDLELHIKSELANFIPFRDVVDAHQLLEQLEKIAAMVVVMTNVAFAAQSVEVTSDGYERANSREGAIGIFSDLNAVPDLHSPSCLRWQGGDIIIPVQISLHYTKMLVSFSTAIASHKQFWVSLMLFSHRLKYATFSDEAGIFHVFRITYCGAHKFIETDEATGYAVLEFRELLSNICATMRLQYNNKDLYDDDLAANILAPHGLKPLIDSQREAISTMVSRFFNNMDTIVADAVEHDDDDLDLDSILSFHIKE